jgi:hypothetical protein
MFTLQGPHNAGLGCSNTLSSPEKEVAHTPRKRKAQHFDWQSAGFWRRPTLARPFVALPSGLQRFTAVFGMGTGGATALLSPESDAGLAIRRLRGETSRCRTLGTVIGDQ